MRKYLVFLLIIITILITGCLNGEINNETTQNLTEENLDQVIEENENHLDEVFGGDEEEIDKMAEENFEFDLGDVDDHELDEDQEKSLKKLLLYEYAAYMIATGEEDKMVDELKEIFDHETEFERYARENKGEVVDFSDQELDDLIMGVLDEDPENIEESFKDRIKSDYEPERDFNLSQDR